MNIDDLVDELSLCTPEDLRALVNKLAELNPEKAYDLGMAVYKANPSKRVTGPPPGSLDGLVVMSVTGVTSSDSLGRVKGIRFLRSKFQEQTLVDAGRTFHEIGAGKPYTLPPSRRGWVEMEAAAWRHAGFIVTITPHGEQPQEYHDVCFRQEVAMICTAD